MEFLLFFYFVILLKEDRAIRGYLFNERVNICNNASVGGLCQGQRCLHVQFKLQIRSPGCGLRCSSGMMITLFFPFICQWL